ncbi:hypothetical protein PTSG_01590 [Salpingoeca rosetta]|uniref:Pentatricopeptide repeat-containing protein-mitochondrial domain-containing protein n=1 Tax=Salpingoeca rosetta (strain ATCC 50818 / BSB-021) TaxID=946362 RepID=F2TYD9_SALR5|nr:uncharacterized protein PTSG_01590 [Salpingoeca rosetta]EGD78613.1 hypothetical protein PTSG_01590 [Salpingoeca rosetta]|eukprot:XP_004997571.1 hypothetical protein PTSG_01590 [Salpingoeca rosetta]
MLQGQQQQQHTHLQEPTPTRRAHGTGTAVFVAEAAAAHALGVVIVRISLASANMLCEVRATAAQEHVVVSSKKAADYLLPHITSESRSASSKSAAHNNGGRRHKRGSSRRQNGGGLFELPEHIGIAITDDLEHAGENSLFTKATRHRWLQADPLVLAQRMRSSHPFAMQVTKHVQTAITEHDITPVDACHMMNVLGQAGRGRLALKVWQHITVGRSKRDIHPDLYCVALRACALSGLLRDAEDIFASALAFVDAISAQQHATTSSDSPVFNTSCNNAASLSSPTSLLRPQSNASEHASTADSWWSPSSPSSSSSPPHHHHHHHQQHQHPHHQQQQQHYDEQPSHDVTSFAPVFAAMQLAFAMQGNVKETYGVVRLMMEKYHLPPHRSHRLHLLLAHARAGDVAGAQACFHDVVAPHASRDDRAHRYLLEAHAQCGDVEGAEHVFASIEAACGSFDARAIISLVKAYRIAGDAAGAHRALERIMREYRMKPPVKAFTAAIRAHADAGDVEGATHTMRLMKECGVEPDVSAFEFLIHAYLNSGNRAEAMRVYERVFTQDSPLRPTPLIHEALLSHHMTAGDAVAAAAVLLRFQLHNHSAARVLGRREMWEVVEQGAAIIARGSAGDGAGGVDDDDDDDGGDGGDGGDSGGGDDDGCDGKRHRQRGVSEDIAGVGVEMRSAPAMNRNTNARDGAPRGSDGEDDDDGDDDDPLVVAMMQRQQQRMAMKAKVKVELTEEERHHVMAMMRNHAWHTQRQTTAAGTAGTGATSS